MPRIALMLGNFVIGISIVGIAAMLPELARALEVSIQHAGLLITAGAVVLCVGSPLMVWATSRLDRRVFLAGSLLVLAAGHFASAAAPGYAALLGLRVAMMIAAAAFTPLAASSVASLVPEPQRSSAVAFVFLGWSLAIAAGLPAMAFLAAHLGWRGAFVVAGVALLAVAALVFSGLPAGLRGAPISMRSWGALARSRLVVLLLVLTVVQTSGQFAVFTYFAPLLTQLTGAGVATISALFLLYGVAGFVGNAIAARLVRALKPFLTSLVFLLCVLLGISLWAFGAGVLGVMAAGVAIWGLGFAAINSMQQARLIAAAPALGSAAVALNTSSLYVGQAIGSALGGFLFAQGMTHAVGYAAVAFLVLSLGVLAMTRN